jgi:hypothetical protein
MIGFLLSFAFFYLLNFWLQVKFGRKTALRFDALVFTFFAAAAAAQHAWVWLAFNLFFLVFAMWQYSRLVKSNGR